MPNVHNTSVQVPQHSLALVNLVDSKSSFWASKEQCKSLRPSSASLQYLVRHFAYKGETQAWNECRASVHRHGSASVDRTSPVTKMPLCYPVWATSKSSAATSP